MRTSIITSMNIGIRKLKIDASPVTSSRLINPTYGATMQTSDWCITISSTPKSPQDREDHTISAKVAERLTIASCEPLKAQGIGTRGATPRRERVGARRYGKASMGERLRGFLSSDTFNITKDDLVILRFVKRVGVRTLPPCQIWRKRYPFVTRRAFSIVLSRRRCSGLRLSERPTLPFRLIGLTFRPSRIWAHSDITLSLNIVAGLSCALGDRECGS